jgi:hypothetical protein
MNPLAWPRQWRELKNHPVYQRERGGWGKPNRFYDSLSRYSPFVVMGAILFGVCAGSSNPALLAGNDALIAFWCLLCLPGMVLNGVTLFGMLMAPALTAPTISMELDRGTWDILRATPLSTRSIIMAKLFGALARLRIWPILFALSLLQGLLLTCSILFTVGSAPGESAALGGVVVGVTSAIRPWLEILFAAFVGMIASTLVKSATTALAASYTAVILTKLFNSSLIWLGIASVFDLRESLVLVASGVGPTAVYLLVIVGLWIGLLRQADRLGAGD